MKAKAEGTTRAPRRRAGKRGGDLDSQQVEILGRSRLKAALIEAGIEVATPERDNGIDLIAFRWRAPDKFVSRPIQMKAASRHSISIRLSYRRIPQLIIAFVMGVRESAPVIYAMKYRELLRVASSLGWTRTPSWIKGHVYFTKSKADPLMKAINKFKMDRTAWLRFLQF